MGMIPRCEAGHNSVNFYLIQHKSYHKYILWGRQNLYIVILFNSCKTNCRRRVAQFGRALRSGRRGRKFESCHSDHSFCHELHILHARNFRRSVGFFPSEDFPVQTRVFWCKTVLNLFRYSASPSVAG